VKNHGSWRLEFSHYGRSLPYLGEYIGALAHYCPAENDLSGSTA